MKRIIVIIEDKKVSVDPKNIDKFSTFKEAHKKAISDAFRQAERLIKIRDRSQEELKKRLYEKGFSENEIEYVIEDLKRKGLIDDKRFTKILIESYIKKGYGIFKIKNKLIEKGIDREIIEKAFEESFEKEFFEQAKTIVMKKIKTYKEKGQVKERIQRYLFTRGFDSEIINKLLHHLKEEGIIR